MSKVITPINPKHSQRTDKNRENSSNQVCSLESLNVLGIISSFIILQDIVTVVLLVLVVEEILVLIVVFLRLIAFF
jgi:hypothetical protein